MQSICPTELFLAASKPGATDGQREVHPTWAQYLGLFHSQGSTVLFKSVFMYSNGNEEFLNKCYCWCFQISYHSDLENFHLCQATFQKMYPKIFSPCFRSVFKAVFNKLWFLHFKQTKVVKSDKNRIWLALRVKVPDKLRNQDHQMLNCPGHLSALLTHLCVCVCLCVVQSCIFLISTNFIYQCLVK